MMLGTGEFYVNDRWGLDAALRKLKRYFNENIQKELRMRAGFISKPELRKMKHLAEMKRQKKQRQRRVERGQNN